MPIVLTDTLSGRKLPLTPREPGHVQLYWCGVTVYSRSHVGHARAMITADLFCRYFRAVGLRVTFVRNYTDIDDKIIARSAQEGLSWEALVDREIRSFNEDVAWLGCLAPTHEPRATTHIPEMLALIERLIAGGFAYPTADGSVYFRVQRFPEYGKLSHQRQEDMHQGEEIDPAKEDGHDFALWKGWKPGEPFWESPWGKGRPGWHLECSAMAGKYLAQPFDIHGGGSDLIFPHHENEIAQSEAAYGTRFADCWVHNGMLTLGSEKMSKSLGNILSIQEAAERVPPEALRMLYLGTHYRAPLDFGPGRLDEGVKAMERLLETLARADTVLGQATQPPPLDGSLAIPTSPFEQQFCEAMDDDLNAAKALGLIFERVRELNRALDAGDGPVIAAARSEIGRVGQALGLMNRAPAMVLETWRNQGQARSGLTDAEIQQKIDERIAARKAKQFKQADEIRGWLQERGIVLEDTPSGTIWKTS
jgi:cysteinyl-tRNA synthetase